MIKIKDYIFNENEITHIVQMSNENLDTDYLVVYGKDKDEHKFISINATFEDIEWNYGNNISESLSYDLAKARIEELEEKNKKLKEDYITLEKDYGTCELENSKLRTEIIEQKDRINKAIEYINNNFEYDKTVRGYIVSSEYVVKLLKLLKGEE